MSVRKRILERFRNVELRIGNKGFGTFDQNLLVAIFEGSEVDQLLVKTFQGPIVDTS